MAHIHDIVQELPKIYFLSEAPKGLRYDPRGKFTQQSENPFLTNTEVDLIPEIWG